MITPETALLLSQSGIEVSAIRNQENRFGRSGHREYRNFQKIIPEEKAFTPEDYLVYKEAFENRQNSDYSIFTDFTHAEVSNNLPSIRLLVQKIGHHIENQLKNQ